MSNVTIEFPFSLAMMIATGAMVNPKSVVLNSTAEHYSNVVDFSQLFAHSVTAIDNGVYSMVGWSNVVNPANAFAMAVDSNNKTLTESCHAWLSSKVSELGVPGNAFIGGAPIVEFSNVRAAVLPALEGSLGTLESMQTLYSTIAAADSSVFSNGAMITSNLGALRFYVTLNQNLTLTPATSIDGLDLTSWVAAMPTGILGTHTAPQRNIVMTFINEETIPGYGE